MANNATEIALCAYLIGQPVDSLCLVSKYRTKLHITPSWAARRAAFGMRGSRATHISATEHSRFPTMNQVATSSSRDSEISLSRVPACREPMRAQQEFSAYWDTAASDLLLPCTVLGD